MKRDLDSRCLQRERRVPPSSFWPIETVSKQIGVSECRIHNVEVRDTEHEFPDRDPRQEPCFAEQSIVSRALQFEQSSQLIGICGQSVEDRFFVVCRWDQSMS